MSCIHLYFLIGFISENRGKFSCGIHDSPPPAPHLFSFSCYKYLTGEQAFFQELKDSLKKQETKYYL